MNALSKILRGVLSFLTVKTTTEACANNGSHAKFMGSQVATFGKVVSIRLHLQITQPLTAGGEYTVAYLHDEWKTINPCVGSSNGGWIHTLDDGTTIKLHPRNNYNSGTNIYIRLVGILGG